MPQKMNKVPFTHGKFATSPNANLSRNGSITITRLYADCYTDAFRQFQQSLSKLISEPSHHSRSTAKKTQATYSKDCIWDCCNKGRITDHSMFDPSRPLGVFLQLLLLPTMTTKKVGNK